MNYLTQNKEEKQTTETFAKAFIRETNLDLRDIAKRFFIIGFRLQEAVRMDYVTALGYNNIEELAEQEFGFKRSTTYGLMQVYNMTAKLNGFRRTMEMQEKYAEYNYSQLLEISKMKYIGGNIKENIKPTNSVRDIQAYVRFWNDYGNKNSSTPDCTLDEWKARQIEEEKPAQPPEENHGQIDGQVTLDELTEKTREQAHMEETQNETKPESVAPPVQTSGLPTCAKPIPEKQKYNFSVRSGVRTFLADYTNWERYFGFIGCFFGDMYYYIFKNNVTIYAVTTKTVTNVADLEAVEKITYFINNDKRKAKEISKGDFEKYCELYKDEL